MVSTQKQSCVINLCRVTSVKQQTTYMYTVLAPSKVKRNKECNANKTLKDKCECL